jgi:CheY-specific phosphatase CheX
VPTSYPPVLGLLKEHFHAACEDGFTAPVREGDAPATSLRGEWVVSIMPFGGEHAHGSLCLVARRDAATALVPSGIVGQHMDARDMLRDVVGESSSLIAGRMKNRLLSHGVALMLGIPTTAYITNLHLGGGHESAVWVSLRSESGPVYVMLDASIAGTSSPDVSSLPTATLALREGELVFL